MRFLTPAEQALLDGARPPERSIIRDLYELLDARLVAGATGGSVTPKGMSAGYSARPEPVVSATSPGAAFEPRRDAVGETSGPLDGPAPSVLEVGAAPEPLFPREEAA